MISTGSGVSEPDSSDEEASERSRYRVEIVPALMEEAAPAPATAPHDRRKMFAKSKSMKNCFSMPAPVGSRYCYQSPPPHDSTVPRVPSLSCLESLSCVSD